jgi:hypothetical protein
MFIAILGSYLLVAALGFLLGFTIAGRFDLVSDIAALADDPTPRDDIRIIRWPRSVNGAATAAYDWSGEPDADRWGDAS